MFRTKVLTQAEEDYIKSQAYLPEHLPKYVTSISNVEPYLINDYLCYYGNNGYLIFIGYPLKASEIDCNLQEIIWKAIEEFKGKYIALIAPKVFVSSNDCIKRASDSYYRLDLSNIKISQKLRNMIRHASRKLYIEKSQKVKEEHLLLISEFIDTHKIDPDISLIFERIPKYLSSVSTAWLYNARNKDNKLVAFSIAEFGSKNYAFYMFNFKSQMYYLPGASDLILYEIIKTAQEMGKSFINLGLGINEGVTFFKKKWGGELFLNYEYCFYECFKPKISDYLQKFL